VAGRIRIILLDPDVHPGHADPDPDRYQFQANVFFSIHINILSKILTLL
jgi:hypothetical protein